MTVSGPGRVCVCLSGQLRAPDDVLPALGALLAAADATVFISVWDSPGRKLEGSIRHPQLERLFTGETRLAIPSRWHGSDRLWAALPDAHARLAAVSGPRGRKAVEALIRQHLPDAVIDVQESDRLDLEFDDPRDDRNAQRMLYLIWRVEQMRRRHEREHGRFDVVFRSRVDIVHFALDFDVWRTMPDDLVMVDGYDPELRHAGDFFAIARPAAMDVYAATFARVIARPLRWINVHQEIGRQVTDAGLRIGTYPIPGRLAQDPTMPAEELLSCIDAQAARGLTSPLHLATASALRALIALDAGDPEGATERLAELDAATLPLEALDGWLAVLAVVAAVRRDLLGALAAAALADRASERQELLTPEHSVLYRVFAELETWGPLIGPTGFLPAATLPKQLAAIAGRLGLTLEDEAQRVLRTMAHDAFTVGRWEAFAVAAGLLDPDLLDLPVGPRWGAAVGLKLAGRLAEAEAWQASAIALGPDHPGANRQQAEIILMQGRPADALAPARRAMALAPQPAHAALLTLVEAQLGHASDPAHLASAVDEPIGSDLAHLPGMTEHLRALRARVAGA